MIKMMADAVAVRYLQGGNFDDRCGAEHPIYMTAYNRMSANGTLSWYQVCSVTEVKHSTMVFV